MKNLDYIERNLFQIKNRIEKAAAAAGRNADDIRLLAAVKYAEADEIIRLRELGVTLMGENRVNQYEEHEKLGAFDGVSVHFIGTLQSNKVKYIAGKVDAIESLDSEKLAEEINRRYEKIGQVARVFCEINSGREPNKSGVMPEDAAAFCEKLAAFSNISVVGFMTMAPICEKNDEYRKYFAETRELALDIWMRILHNIDVPLLSMGMSNSFEAAILEGANIVRVGRGLFVKD